MFQYFFLGTYHWLILMPLSSILKWAPTGRRLITGSQSGEFTLWNGQSFNFEMILQVVICVFSFEIHNGFISDVYFYSLGS